jgi:GTP-binding protein HflX
VELTTRRKPALQARVAFPAQQSLEELAVLAASAGAIVQERILQQRPAFDPATLVGSGKLDEIKALVASREADLVIFDHELSGMQQRNLEEALGCRVVDRNQLILDIFARRARTREGQLQVELAQLNYLLPRLTGRGTAMSRLGGGIGTRGPGETQLETDRRRINKRLKKIADELDSVRGSRGVQRRQRQAVPLVTLALAGYTNAGKSTLFNRLTESGVLADARMFATLDPTVRHLTLPSRRRILVSDTVGFIRQLPTTLVKAFRATLEEVVEAALILHVIDATAPAASEHSAHVRAVLAEIGAEKTPQLLVLNKCDLLAPDDAGRESIQARLAGEAGGAPAVWISARPRRVPFSACGVCAHRLSARVRGGAGREICRGGMLGRRRHPAISSDPIIRFRSPSIDVICYNHNPFRLWKLMCIFPKHISQVSAGKELRIHKISTGSDWAARCRIVNIG